jgi:hypothetical protein
MDRFAEKLRKLAVGRRRLLHSYRGQDRRVLGVVSAASFPICTVLRLVARYRQSHLTSLPREHVTDNGPHCGVSVGINEASGDTDSPAPPKTDARFSLQGRDTPVHRWIHAHDRQQFRSDGFMVIRNVISPSLIANAAREIAAFVGGDLTDSTTWYGGPMGRDGIVPMHHSQSQWDIRQSPSLYQVFTEFFGTPQLMVDINRCIVRPPIHPRFPKISHGTIHWDTDPRGPRPPSVQGVVLLSDVGCDGGGFQCLPDVFQNLDAWLNRYARRDDFDFFYPGLNYWKTTQVEGKAGDVILWSTRLPHGSATNLSNRPRLATFVSMQP